MLNCISVLYFTLPYGFAVVSTIRVGNLLGAGDTAQAILASKCSLSAHARPADHVPADALHSIWLLEICAKIAKRSNHASAVHKHISQVVQQAALPCSAGDIDSI